MVLSRERPLFTYVGGDQISCAGLLGVVVGGLGVVVGEPVVVVVPSRKVVVPANVPSTYTLTVQVPVRGAVPAGGNSLKPQYPVV